MKKRELKRLARAHAAACISAHADEDDDRHISSDPLTKEEFKYIRKEMRRIAEILYGGRLPKYEGTPVDVYELLANGESNNVTRDELKRRSDEIHSTKNFENEEV